MLRVKDNILPFGPPGIGKSTIPKEGATKQAQCRRLAKRS